MRRKHEVINGHKISVWDCPKFIDRYTVVYLDDIFQHPAHHNAEYVNYIAMSDNPFHPQGFCQHGEMPINSVQYKGRGGCFDKRIKFADLPPDCQKAVLQDFEIDEQEAKNG
jgi:hypothetical protein